MKKIKLRMLIIFSLAGLSAALLLHVSQMVQDAEDKLSGMRHAATQERETIRVLNAEWAHLNNPQRLEKLATEYLGLVPPGPEQILSVPSVLPEPVVPTAQEQLFQHISQPAIYVPMRKPDHAEGGE